MAVATEEPKANKKTVDNEVILGLLFKQVPKVKNTLKTVVVNVYADRYRINIYQVKEHPFMPNCGFIAASYFVTHSNDALKILGSYNAE